MFKNVLFDLDGTLIDSYEGITKSVNYALEKSGKAPAPDDVLRKFIGPPLLYSFEKFCRMSRREADAAVKFYRERYAVRGKFENTVYDGVPRLLKALRENGVKVCLATSKPIVFAKEILKHTFSILRDGGTVIITSKKGAINGYTCFDTMWFHDITIKRLGLKTKKLLNKFPLFAEPVKSICLLMRADNKGKKINEMLCPDSEIPELCSKRGLNFKYYQIEKRSK